MFANVQSRSEESGSGQWCEVMMMVVVEGGEVVEEKAPGLLWWEREGARG